MPQYKNLEDRHDQKRRYYAKHRIGKVNSYVPYSAADIALIMEHQICDVDISKRLSRSVNAIQTMRSKIKHYLTREDKSIPSKSYLPLIRTKIKSKEYQCFASVGNISNNTSISKLAIRSDSAKFREITNLSALLK